MKAAMLLVSVLATGCVPVVQHGPWVRDGFGGTVGGSAVVVSEFDADNRLAPLISFEGGMRWGFANTDTTSDGFALGVQVPLIALLAATDNNDSFESNFLRILHLDGYLATRLTKDLDASFGITGSSFHTMPYAQVGKYDKWYATQAVLMMSESDDWLWAPSFTWVQRGTGNTRTHFTINGAVATADNDDVFWMLGFSIMFEMARARN